jgi:hypothetical protein
MLSQFDTQKSGFDKCSYNISRMYAMINGTGIYNANIRMNIPTEFEKPEITTCRDIEQSVRDYQKLMGQIGLRIDIYF